MRRWVVASVAFGLSFVGASACCDRGNWGDPERHDIGVSADLNMVVAPSVNFGGQINSPIHSHAMVGSEGTFLLWSRSEPSDVRLSTVPGGAELLGLASINYASQERRWWVVGEGGFMATATESELDWAAVELETSADLHAILVTELGSLVVVGDELVRVRGEEGSWIEPEAPPEGWGQLRAIEEDRDGRLWAAGLDGVLVTAEAPDAAWVAEASGTSADLHVLGELRHQPAAFGAAGLAVQRDEDSSTWSVVDIGVSADIIAVEPFYSEALLTRDGRVYIHDGGLSFRLHGTYPGARSLDYGVHLGGQFLLVVGEGGYVSREVRIYCGKA